MPESRTSPLPREKSRVYLRKAISFARSMDQALEDRNWDGAGLAGIHAVISACDALTVFQLGVRSTGQNHSEVLKLLPKSRAPDRIITKVRSVLSEKNKVEYETRQLSLDEATRIAAAVRQVLDFVVSQIGTI